MRTSLLSSCLLGSALSFVFNKVGHPSRFIHSSTLETVEQAAMSKLPWKEEGYSSYSWNGLKVNYVEAGDPQKPPVLLIHGFGASAYHWRYNIPDLARDHHVFAIDMIGFGGSDKPVLEYTAELWRDQVLDFIEKVIFEARGKYQKNSKVVVAGNSLGGFTALYASASQSDRASKLINGCILLNAAGRFMATSPPSKEETPEWKQAIFNFIQKLIITGTFYYTKQPARINQVLKQVYTNPVNVDDELVQSIEFASRDPNAAEVFYRIISKNGNGPPVYIDQLLEKLDIPLLLLWGERDPWIRPAAADRIQSMYPRAVRVSLDAGHCPHDETPAEVNKAIREFVQSCL